ncbi:MAG: glutathione S-transferase, partial [Robiginitomaculum sp.]|nr:glutathione S-transferase [Robiginitomaculum sp.]
MITLHHLNNSRSQRVLWLMEELELEYKIKHYSRDPKTRRAPPSLKTVHPLGRAPVIEHGDNIIAETGAIIEYIIEARGNGRFIPKAGTQEDYNYIHFLHYGEGSAMFPLLLSMYTSYLGEAAAPLAPIISAEMKTHFDYIEYHLTAHKYFAGNEMTGADFQMIFPLEAAKSHGRLLGYTACIEFVDKMQARPGWPEADYGDINCPLCRT